MKPVEDDYGREGQGNEGEHHDPECGTAHLIWSPLTHGFGVSIGALGSRPARFALPTTRKAHPVRYLRAVLAGDTSERGSLAAVLVVHRPEQRYVGSVLGAWRSSLDQRCPWPKVSASVGPLDQHARGLANEWRDQALVKGLVNDVVALGISEQRLKGRR